jgi:hypothetical protein
VFDDLDLPKRGAIFWPVGTGDSTTVIVDDEHWVQIDLHQLAASEGDDDERTPVVDRLCELAPERDGRPYLAAFAATHLDKDHILGFRKLNEQATIGELWFTPRVFWDAENLKGLCDDAKAFVEEVEDRMALIAKEGKVGTGNRLMIIGDDEILSEPPYSELPAECFTAPGSFFSALDGDDLAEIFRAYILAPRKGDGSEERNDTSLGLQILLADGERRGTLVTLGDLAYPDVKDIFEREDDENLLWAVFQAPHHCSRKVMHWQGDGEAKETFRQDVMDLIEAAADERGAVIVASCECVPAKDEPGANPPHRAAASAYEEITDAGCFVITGDHAPDPLVFELGDDGLTLRDAAAAETTQSAPTVTEAALAAGGASSAGHSSAVGFG